MRVVTSVAGMQLAAKRWRREGARVGFVPTMGYLHAGHISLVDEARRRVRKSGKVVVSIYVNPTQFAPHEDLSKYPRDLKRDLALCRQAGVDIVFVPTDHEMYRRQADHPHSTYVVEEAVSQGMEGASRPTHFRGVATIVAKLFNLVLPDVAVFGAKDYQQAALIRRMVRDLNFPLEIVVAPTVREPDGLALSSRNKYLNEAERAQAVALWCAIQEAQRQVRSNPAGVASGRLEARLRRLITGFRPDPTVPRRPKNAAAPEAHDAATTPANRPIVSPPRVDYIAFFDPDSLKPRTRVTRGTHLALAVIIGKTRLIDNARLD